MSKQRPCILVVDDDDSLREALVSVLEDAGYDLREADGVASALASLHALKPDAMLLDIRLRDGDGLALLAELRSQHPELPVIMATAYSDSDRTIAAMRDGAFEFVTKPFDFDLLLATVARAVRVPPRARLETMAYEGRLIGSSAAMLEVWKAIGRAAASCAPVLITGESGVGKELVARAIHEHGLQSQGPLIAVNLAALPPSLLESELFGHERGAFTGASNKRAGRFELAANGTLFLDEIADLDLALQTKLLRVLEDSRFERVGSQTSIASDARIIAATSKPVSPRTPGSTLREDLYYRLSVVRIEVPPLREHPQDIPLLVEAFLRNNGHGSRAVSEAAMRRLIAYEWPGNVRELRHTLENACVMSSAEVLDVADLALPLPATVTVAGPEWPLQDDLHLATHVARTERRVIARALEVAKGNRAQAARLLGIRRALLYTRMKELGLYAAEDADD
jgi:two-component system response regulator AtoC